MTKYHFYAFCIPNDDIVCLTFCLLVFSLTTWASERPILLRLLIRSSAPQSIPKPLRTVSLKFIGKRIQFDFLHCRLLLFHFLLLLLLSSFSEKEKNDWEECCCERGTTKNESEEAEKRQNKIENKLKEFWLCYPPVCPANSDDVFLVDEILRRTSDAAQDEGVEFFHSSVTEMSI